MTFITPPLIVPAVDPSTAESDAFFLSAVKMDESKTEFPAAAAIP
jgi:hypothetical protein